MEVIARKSPQANTSNSLFMGMGIFGLVMDVALFIGFMINGDTSSQDIEVTLMLGAFLVALLAGSLFFLLLGLKLKIRYKNMPDEVIIYDDGEIVFADGYSCKPSDILDVDCFKGTPRMRALNADPDGWLIVTTKERTLKYDQIERVQSACERLKFYIRSTAQDEIKQST